MVGSGGSNRIRSAIVQTLLSVVDAGTDVQAAAMPPRLHFEDGVVYAEPGADLGGLEAAGHALAALRASQPVLRGRPGRPPRLRHRRAQRRRRPAPGRGGRGGGVTARRWAALAALALSGCGARAPDLFVVQRTGTIPGARLDLRVSDQGTVSCNGAAPRRLADEQVLRARELARGLEAAIAGGRQPAPGRGGVLSYRVTMARGTVSFDDTSPGLPPSLAGLQGFTRTVARRVCGLRR